MFSIRTFAVMLFLAMLVPLVGAAPSNISVSVNGGDGYTGSLSVIVSLDAAGAVGCNISNDGSAYEAVPDFSPPMDTPWALAPGDDGARTVYLVCVDGGGELSGAVSDTISVDTHAPEAGTFSPANGSSTSDATPTISVRLSDPSPASGIDEASITLRLDGSAASGPSFNPSTGILSYTPTSAISLGSHTARATFSDEAGNSADYIWSFAMNTGPSISNVTPSDGSAIDDARPAISATVSSGAPIDAARTVFRLDGTNVSGDADYSTSTGKLSYEPGSSLSEKNHTVEVIVYDTSGMSVQKNWSFLVDKTAPHVGLLVPADDSELSELSEISAEVTDNGSGLDLSTLEMLIDDVDVTEGADFDDDRLVFEYVSGMSGGLHDVGISVSDKAGNDMTFYWTFTLREAFPSVSEKTPAGDSLTNDRTPEISAVLKDTGTSGLEPSSISLYVDGEDVTSDASFSASSGRLSYTPGANLSEGAHTVRIRVSSKADKESEVSWTFKVDGTPPSRVTGLLVRLDGGNSLLSWQPSGSSDLAGYYIYAETAPFTSVSGLTPKATINSTERNYSYATTKRFHFAVVAFDRAANPSDPALGQNCGSYEGGAWKNNECCWDHDCGSGAACDTATHACVAGEEPESSITQAQAGDSIDAAEQEILDAAALGNDVSEASLLLGQARSAYEGGDYAQAHGLAIRASQAAGASPAEEPVPEAAETAGSGKEPNPCCPSAILPLLLLAACFMRSR